MKGAILGIISILCIMPSAVLFAVRQFYPSTLINTMITLSLVALASSLAGVIFGVVGAIFGRKTILLSAAGIVLNLFMLLLQMM
jgi:hypothetical protein